MSKTPNYDAKVKAILDELKPGERTCALTGEKWQMTDEELTGYKRFNVPPSNCSPLTRWRLITSWFIGNQIWYQKHPETGVPLVTAVHPATGIKVLPDKEWFDRDFSIYQSDALVDQPFFSQLRRLQLQVPMPAQQTIVEPVNSVALVSLGVEDSYFVLASRCKRSLYTCNAVDVEDSSEVMISDQITGSFNVLDCVGMHQCKFVRESRQCINSAFLFDCHNCENCFGATNQRNKKYLWFNEQLSETEWRARLAAVDLSKRSVLEEYKRKFHDMVATSVWPENFNERTENCTGDYLRDCVNMTNCFQARDNSSDMLDCCVVINDSHGCMSCAGCFFASNCYMSVPSQSSQCLFSFETRQSQNCEYCIDIFNCENCFGCIGLNRKKFCIFNKQYSESDYWKTVDALKCAMLDRGEYGQWMPASMSPSYFWDSSAVGFFAADQTFAEKIGANTFAPESEGAIGEIGEIGEASQLVDPSTLPDSIDDLSDDFAGKAMFDQIFKRRFAYLKPEIAFHKKMGVALSDRHYIARMNALMWDLNTGVFQPTSCAGCQKTIRVGMNRNYPDRTVYCKSCYLAFIESR